MREVAQQVTDTLTLGEHVYADVYWVTLGKLLDKQKLLGSVLKRKGITVNLDYLSNQVGSVMTTFVSVDLDLLKETADYYRKKYSQYD